MRIGWLLLALFISTTTAEEALLSVEWAEQYIKKNHPQLMQDSEHDHVMSLYYFGHSNERRLMGLERVRGEDYLQYFTLLLFQNETLLGYYSNVMSFPSSITVAGNVQFPMGITGRLKNKNILFNINMLPESLEPLCLEQRQVKECYEWHSVKAKQLLK